MTKYKMLLRKKNLITKVLPPMDITLNYLVLYSGVIQHSLPHMNTACFQTMNNV
jgi:hypothetical protein